jgi:LPXTG-site transpeptidase (sortase) family protein
MLTRAIGTTLQSRFGTALILCGLAMICYSLAAHLGLVPGGYTTVPDPVALTGTGQRSVRLEATPEALSVVEDAVAPVAVVDPPVAPTEAVAPALAAATQAQQAPVEPTAVLAEAVAPAAPGSPSLQGVAPKPAAGAAALAVPLKLNPADAEDRRAAARAARPGAPVRLLLPSIKVDTEVKPGGLIDGPNGEPEWETLPFVATSYPMLAPVGGPGNAVISGHVVTLREGNVFRDLYQVELGEPIEVFTADSHFTYVVEEIKLVAPTAVEVMAPSEDARLTVITCGGTFDPRTRTFSDRLIVIGKLVNGERL